MDLFDATARKVLDEMRLMEARLTEKIAGRCDGVECRVDARCDELHSHFTARCYTIQQQAEPVFDEGPIFDEEPVFEGEPFPSTTDYIDGKRMVDAAERQGMEATSQVECALLEDATARIVDEYQARLQLPPDQAPGYKATYHLKEKADFHKVADKLVQIRFEEMPSAPVRGKDALLHELHTCVRDGDVGAVSIYGMAGVGKTAFLKAVTEGGNAFESGLIAKTNRGILYVDEVNLLDDHLVDVLLDSAAPGWNTVERKGIFISHPAHFILIPLEIFHVYGMIRPMPWPSFTSSINYCMNLDARFVWKPPWSLQRYTRASIALHELLTWLGYELIEALAQQKCGDNCGPSHPARFNLISSEQLLMVLSSSAWSGTETATTWRLQGQIQHQDILVLINSGSSHTSISDKCFPLLTGVQPLERCLNVKVANGQVISCSYQLPQAGWSMSGYQFVIDLIFLPLPLVDLALGRNWLQVHSTMKVGWYNKWMIIPYQGTSVCLQGLVSSFPSGALVELQLLLDHPISESAGEHRMSTLEPRVQSILSQFAEAFAEPVKLHAIEEVWDLLNEEHNPEVVIESSEQLMMALSSAGSSHTFISEKWLPMFSGVQTLDRPMTVKVANGHILSCGLQLRAAEWYMGGYQFSDDLKLLHVSQCQPTWLQEVLQGYQLSISTALASHSPNYGFSAHLKKLSYRSWSTLSAAWGQAAFQAVGNVSHATLEAAKHAMHQTTAPEEENQGREQEKAEARQRPS